MKWERDGTTVYAVEEIVVWGKPRTVNRFSANVQGHRCSTEELESYATLMKAAPDLFDALRSFVDDDNTLTESERLAKAKDAIAKAMGEA